MNIAIISQARMLSSRLPGKVLLTIEGKTLLEYHIERLLKSGLPVIIATTTQPEDQVIVDICQKMAISVYRGSLNNVLDRYYKCGLQFKLDTIIRVTTDCPLIDGELIAAGLKQFQQIQCDYISNTVKRTYPRGFDFEIMRFSAIKKAHENASYDFEKEHVTPYIWRNHPNDFIIEQYTQNVNKSPYRLTVDTPEDLEVIKTLIVKYHANSKTVSQICAIMDRHPEISEINKHIEQKQYGQ